VRNGCLLSLPIAVLGALLVGCGTTEKSGTVGEALTANGLKVTVDRVDTSVHVPKHDITGLSQPSPGTKLVGTRVYVCSEHGGAIGAYDFGLDTTAGGHGQLKYPEENYRRSFDSVRIGCHGGWVVFQIPVKAKPDKVTFGFEDTGSAEDPGSEVDAKFSWDAAG
jgi:hypothetical protein